MKKMMNLDIKYATIFSGKSLNTINGLKAKVAIKTKDAKHAGMSVDSKYALAAKNAENAMFAKEAENAEKTMAAENAEHAMFAMNAGTAMYAGNEEKLMEHIIAEGDMGKFLQAFKNGKMDEDEQKVKDEEKEK